MGYTRSYKYRIPEAYHIVLLFYNWYSVKIVAQNHAYGSMSPCTTVSGCPFKIDFPISGFLPDARKFETG